MNIGISPSDLEEIRAVFEKTAAVEEVLVFGSRAKGDFKPGSDLDLAVKGKAFDFNQFLKLLVKLDEPGFLYKIDLVNYNTIESRELIEHIARVGIKLYSRAPKPLLETR